MLSSDTLITVARNEISDDRGTPGADRSAEYDRRKLAGSCTRCDQRAAIDDSQYCAPCRKRITRIKRTSDKRRRSVRAATGLCVECGLKAPAYRCTACSIKQGRLRGTPGADRKTGDRREWRTETDGRRRNRNRGQARRGAPDTRTRNLFDVKIAAQIVERWRDGLEAAESVRDGASAQERVRNKAAWLQHVRHLSSLADDVLEREE